MRFQLIRDELVARRRHMTDVEVGESSFIRVEHRAKRIESVHDLEPSFPHAMQ